MLTVFHLFLKIIKNHKKWIFGCLHRLMNANERESGKEGNKKKEQEESRIQSYRLCRSLKNLYFLLPGNINWNSLFSSFFVASSLHIFMIPRLLTNFRRKKRRNEGGQKLLCCRVIEYRQWVANCLKLIKKIFLKISKSLKIFKFIDK